MPERVQMALGLIAGAPGAANPGGGPMGIPGGMSGPGGMGGPGMPNMPPPMH